MSEQKPDRDWIWILLVLVAAAALTWVGMTYDKPAHESDGEALGAASTTFQERSGRTVRLDQLEGKVWTAGFIFTRCTGPCPMLSVQMAELQKEIPDADFRLVSFTVDPAYDTPARLRKYADQFEADSDRWWFLTGNKEQIHNFIRDQFKLAAGENEGADIGMHVAHSTRLVLVDREGNIVGRYDGTDPKEVAELKKKAKELLHGHS